MTENKIAHAHSDGMQSYYLAEAGLQEMVFRLKNDETYKTNFEDDPSWTTSFVTDNPFYGESNYTVTIQNTSEAHGDIISTGFIDLADDTSTQRIVKTAVFKALGESVGGNPPDLGDNALLTDNHTYITASQLSVLGGSIHSNNEVTAWLISKLTTDQNLTTINNINKYVWSTITVGGEMMSANYPPAASQIHIPAISFDDLNDPNSLKAQADGLYTEQEFEDLVENSGPVLTLNHIITYVTGDIVVPNGKKLTTNNGLIVADGSITLGTGSVFSCVFGDDNNFEIIMNTNKPGVLSGMVAKESIEFSYCTKEINIDGVVYANNEINIYGNSNGINIEGVVIARNFNVFSVWTPVEIDYNYDFVIPFLDSFSGAPEFAPVISVEHWEEEY